MYKNWLKSYQNIREVPLPKQLHVRHGRVPKTLDGTYYKSSPGLFDKFGIPVAHPFDGDGYVSAIHFYKGDVLYQAQFVNTQHRIHEDFIQSRLYTGVFGTPPHGCLVKNPANTNVVHWGDYLIVFCESGAPYLLDPYSLKTIGTLSPFHDGLPVRVGVAPIDKTLHTLGILGDAVCAHPKIVDDRLVLYSNVFEKNHSKITFFELSKDYKILSTTEYRTESNLYFIHDFQVTDNAYIFVEHNVHLNLKNSSKGLVNCFEEHPTNHFNRIHIVPRNRTSIPLVIDKPTCKEILPGFVTHYVGLPIQHSKTYEFWFILYPKVIPWDDMDQMQKGALYKTVWDSEHNFIYQERVTDHSFEFPVQGETKDDVYVLMYESPSTKSKPHVTLAKLNLRNKENIIKDTWTAGTNMTLGEPMYAGGHVMTTCFDAIMNESCLYIFDSQKISNGPICIVDLPYPTPIGLHGFWSAPPDAL